ncbi:MAG: glycosyltransferase family 10 [Hyphomonadaceae bacterium]
MRRIFLVDDMQHTPFVDEAFLELAKLEVVAAPRLADFVVSRRLAWITPEIMDHGRPAIAWSHEPFFAPDVPPYVRSHHGGREAFVFSVWNRNVYTDNYYYAPRRRQNLDFVRPGDATLTKLSNRRAIVLARYSERSLMIGGRDVSLYSKRSRLALALNAADACEIHGRDWPGNVSVSDSRDGGRTTTKLAELSRFPFALCSENCIGDFYVTEKIWEAIEGGSLPLYYSQPSLAGLFPEDSFIDLSSREYAEPERLVELMKTMSEDEWIERMNRCIAVYRTACQRSLQRLSRERTRKILISFIDSI